MAPAIIAAAISALASVGSTVAAGASSRKKNDEAAAQLEGLRRQNTDWYKTKMSQDYTSRADAQAAIQKQRELLNEQYRNARATSIVAGGTDAQLAAQKELANKSVAETMSDIAANGASAQDQTENQYLATNAQLSQQQIAAKTGQANAVAQAGAQAAGAGVNLTGALLDYDIKKSQN